MCVTLFTVKHLAFLLNYLFLLQLTFIYEKLLTTDTLQLHLNWNETIYFDKTRGCLKIDGVNLKVKNTLTIMLLCLLLVTSEMLTFPEVFNYLKKTLTIL